MASSTNVPRSCIQMPVAAKASTGGVRGLKTLTIRAPGAAAGPRRVTRMASIAAADVPDMEKRNTMNLVVLGGATSVTLGLAGPFFSFFVPKGAGSSAGTQAAKDALGNDVKADEWVQTHLPGDRSLTQGLKGDPTYLVVTEDKTVEKFGINGVCTHLGCVVPWVTAENKFKCPCHGSQYNSQGKVVRGPAPLSLALAHADVSEDGIVMFSPWKETDFRTGLPPWWS